MTFEFKRRINFYLLSWYLPATLIVVLSWVGFWIDIKSTPARISLGTITILAIGSFLIGEQEGFPSVSYVRAIDIYLIACFVFVFGCMVEYAIVHCAKRLEEEREQQKKKGNKVIVILWIVIGQNDLFNLNSWIQKKNVKIVMLWQREEKDLGRVTPSFVRSRRQIFHNIPWAQLSCLSRLISLDRLI